MVCFAFTNEIYYDLHLHIIEMGNNKIRPYGFVEPEPQMVHAAVFEAEVVRFQLQRSKPNGRKKGKRERNMGNAI